MKISKRPKYLKDVQKLTQSHTLSIEQIEECERLFEENPQTSSLRYHPIKCKRDKNRYSITVPNTQYRILATIRDGLAQFRTLVNHKSYDRINKNC